MEREIASSAQLIRPGERPDVVAFGCTSGAIVIGDETIAARIHEVRPGIACTTPIKAAITGLVPLP
jgi:maleate isomerase